MLQDWDANPNIAQSGFTGVHDYLGLNPQPFDIILTITLPKRQDLLARCSPPCAQAKDSAAKPLLGRLEKLSQGIAGHLAKLGLGLRLTEYRALLVIGRACEEKIRTCTEATLGLHDSKLGYSQLCVRVFFFILSWVTSYVVVVSLPDGCPTFDGFGVCCFA